MVTTPPTALPICGFSQPQARPPHLFEHGRLNRSSVLSNVPAEATRIDRAGPGYKVIRLRGLSHTDNMARNRQYFHVATDESRSFHLRLRPKISNAWRQSFSAIPSLQLKAQLFGLSLKRLDRCPKHCGGFNQC